MTHVRGWQLLGGLVMVAALETGSHAFPISIDARALSAPQFAVDGGSGLPTDSVATLDLTEANHTFVPNGPGFSFSVTAGGTLDFDPSLDGYVSGRGTTTLKVIGLHIQVDATALSSPQFSINRGNGGHGDTDVVTTLTLLPGDYAEFNAPAGSFVDFPFTVTTTSTVDFDASLDGFVGVARARWWSRAFR